MKLASPLAPRGLPLSPEQIGHGLACVPRWNGGTVAPWSVLQHSIVCMGVAQAATSPDPVVILYAGLHDAEEVFIGDIPKPYKTDDMCVRGREIRAKILESYGLPVASAGVWEIVKAIDEQVACAEKRVLTHPRFAPEWGAEFDMKIVDMIWDTLKVDPWYAAEMYARTLRAAFGTPEVQQLKDLST